MTPGETKKMLVDASAKHAKDNTVKDWLAEQGIDDETFSEFLLHLVATMPEGASPFVQLGVGFGLGWTAHDVMLATPAEAGPAPNLSESLE